MEKIELNEKEKKVLSKFPKNGEPIAIAELAKAAFPSMGARAATRGNSWVRNSVRRPLRLKLIKQLGRGLYVLGSRSTSSKTKTKARKSTAKKTTLTPTQPLPNPVAEAAAAE